MERKKEKEREGGGKMINYINRSFTPKEATNQL